MKELGYEMKLEESSGDHQWKYWDAKIPGCPALVA